MKVDRRTRAGRFHGECVDALVGMIIERDGACNAAQRVLIEMTATMFTRLALLTPRFMDPAYGSGSYKQFVSFNNAARQNLVQLGLKEDEQSMGRFMRMGRGPVLDLDPESEEFEKATDAEIFDAFQAVIGRS